VRGREFAAELKFYHAEELFGIDGFEKQWRKLGLREDVHLVLNVIEGHAREKDDGKGTAMFLHVGEDVKTVHVGHLQIEKYEINRSMLQMKNRRFAAAGFIDVVAGVSQEVTKRQPFNGGVIAKKDACAGRQ
jgi:hypothetical protein